MFGSLLWKRLKQSYGLVTIGCAVLLVVITAPGQTIGIAAFVQPFSESFHVNNFWLSVSYFGGTVLSGIVLGRAGRLIDYYGVRRVGTGAAFGLGLTLLVIAQFSYWLPNHWLTLLLLTLAFFSLRLFGQGLLTMMSKILINHWFTSYRGRVGGVVGTFMVLAMSVSPVLFNHLLQTLTWQATYRWLFFAIGIIAAVLIYTLVRNQPEQLGLTQDNPFSTSEQICERQTSSALILLTMQQIRADKRFWIYIISFAYYSFFFTAFSFHVTDLFARAGFSRSTALSIFIPATFISIVTKLVSGWYYDTPSGKRHIDHLLYAYLLAIICFTLALLELSSTISLLLLICAQGVATGFFVTLSTVVWSHYWGKHRLGSIMGLSMQWLVLASALGPVLFGAAIDGLHSIASVLIVFILVVLSTLFYLYHYRRRLA